jgi:vacuolar protein sorting-associated protein 33A
VRSFYSFSYHTVSYDDPDTGLTELLVPLTRTAEFNQALEIQQSTIFIKENKVSHSFPDLLASYEISNQINAIEDMIARGEDMQLVLRLLCLTSITAGGIKTKVLENIKRDFLQVSRLWITIHACA